MKIVIFGAGEAGAEAVQLIGKENIEFVCDNRELSGEDFFGIPMINFGRFREVCREYVNIIAANEVNAKEISAQFEAYGISDYVFFYDDVRLMFLKNASAAMDKLQYQAERYPVKVHFYFQYLYKTGTSAELFKKSCGHHEAAQSYGIPEKRADKKYQLCT